MKKIVRILFLCILAFTIVACSKPEEKPVDLENMTAEEEAKYYNLEGTYHRVTFKNGDEVVMVALFKEGTDELYVKGEKVEVPTVEPREGYNGNWTMSVFNSIKRDFEDNYVWKIKTYKVYFIEDGETLKSNTYDYGAVLTEADAPEISAKYGETSREWDVTFPLTVTNVVTIYPKSEKIVFAEEENTEFNDYLEELFYEVLGTEPLGINFDLYDADAFFKEGVFDFNECIFDGYDFSKEGEDEYYEALLEIINKLKSFANENITKKQYLDKIVLLDYFEKDYAFKDYYNYGTLLGSYLGYQAQLPSTLAEYHFYNEKCINDYLSYLEQTQSIFEGIVGLENQKAEEGRPMTDEIINRVIEQCDNFINLDPENPCFLIQAANDKIDACEFLTAKQKQDYKDKNTDYVNNKFLPAYTYLKAELEKMLGRENDVVTEDGSKYYGTYAQMESGKEYYQAKIQSKLGTSMTVQEIYDYVGKKLGINMSTYSQNSAAIKEYNTKNIMTELNLKLEDIIPYIMEASKDDFPELGVTLNYTIQDVPAAMRKNSSPAYYFISAFDANIPESIYINPESDDLKVPTTYMFSTVAHEGFPGHMYQNVYMKTRENIPNVRKLISYTSYAEAWTIHIENYILKYMYDEQTAQTMLAYNSLSYLIIGMLDMGVNYFGWNVEKATDFLGRYFNIDAEGVLELYYDCTEIPTNYLMYYYSVFRLEDIKTKFKTAMGADYSDLLFHKLYLECGSVSFDVVDYYIMDYAETFKASK